jgi:hypothetical protein
MTRKLELLPDWRDIVKRAWSVRLMLLAFVATLAEAMWPVFAPEFEFRFAGVVSAVLIAAAFVARLMAQKGDDK